MYCNQVCSKYLKKSEADVTFYTVDIYYYYRLLHVRAIVRGVECSVYNEQLYLVMRWKCKPYRTSYSPQPNRKKSKAPL